MAQNDKDNKFNYGLGVSYSIEKVSFAYSYEIYEFINYAYIQKILISGLLKFKTHQVNLSFVTAEQPKRIYIKHTNNKLFPVRINSLYGFNGSYRIYPEKIRIKQILSFFAFCDINYLIISTEGKCSGFYMDQTGMNVTNGMAFEKIKYISNYYGTGAEVKLYKKIKLYLSGGIGIDFYKRHYEQIYPSPFNNFSYSKEESEFSTLRKTKFLAEIGFCYLFN